MKKINALRINIFLLSLISLPFFIFSQQNVNNINTQKSEIVFFTTNFGIEIKGIIKGLSGYISLDTTDLASAYFSVILPVKGIRTGSKIRDDHLQEKEFFDAMNYPNISFKSSEIKKENNTYLLSGMLTIKGISNNVLIPFTLVNNIFKGTFSINRSDYNIGGNGFFSTIGEKVTINITCFKEL